MTVLRHLHLKNILNTNKNDITSLISDALESIFFYLLIKNFN